MSGYPCYRAYLLIDLDGGRAGRIECPSGLKYEGIGRKATRKWATEQASKEAPRIVEEMKREGLKASFRSVRLERIV